VNPFIRCDMNDLARRFDETSLATVVHTYNWAADHVVDQDGWILFVLRREAEALIRSR
jgi:hypothetical protein